MRFQGQPWSVVRVIDFESALRSDPISDSHQQEARDREIYRSFASNTPQKVHEDRSAAFSYWTEAVRLQRTQLPGSSIVSIWKFLSTLLMFGAFLLGLAYAGGLLHYMREEGYVSAPRIFLLTIGLQLLTTVAALVVSGIVRGKTSDMSSMRLWFVVSLLSRFGPRIRDSMSVVADAIGKHRALLLAGAMAPVQASVAALNFGILVSLLVFHFSVTDVRFGWTVTHDITDEQMHTAVAWVGAPWSWITAATPTLDQIKRSRAESGAREENKDASRAWAYFLLASLVTYGVILRLMVVEVLERILARELRRLEFAGEPYDAMWIRMISAKPQEPEPPDPKPGWFRKLLIKLGIRW